jgi:hypothetical protein
MGRLRPTLRADVLGGAERALTKRQTPPTVSQLSTICIFEVVNRQIDGAEDGERVVTYDCTGLTDISGQDQGPVEQTWGVACGALDLVKPEVV